ncbi:hypothetical protein LOTGIDRAFT_174983 [Lottia gigantea]|uniref:Uncharacterized protein n=1 Tax=Lottia gigantea TaxID=225164 RepID=V4AMK4_LOTGI|nr:hypothetical protein LOTGIDRAFT_174983 [Lottia gigantea]ESO96000.1 hypothetical protein LOTGIDRAFT_174983 [Lottia gigantea]
MANKFGLGSLSLETKKPNTTAWINKAKPYFLDQIGDTLQGDLDMNNFSITNLKSPENNNDAIHKKYLIEQLNLIEVNKNHLNERIGDVKRFFKRQLNNKDFIDDTKLQQEVTSLKNFIQQQLVNVVDKTQLQTLDDKITKQKIDLKQLIANINPGKLTIEITFPIQVKVDSLFFRQNSISSNKFNARKVLQFINGTKNVETKELEINDKNNKISHLHEIKTNGQYIDRIRMLIIPDNEKDEFTLSDFDMLLETETPPSMNIIRNPEPQKKDISRYLFLRATDFEYVKLYFVDNDIFTSLDIHKSQQNQNFLIRDDVFVKIFVSIEKPKFSVHLNKINDSKEQISLVTVTVNSKAAISEVHLI